jgi:predicted amidohydrolase
MTRIVTIGAAQLGPIQRADTRASVVRRMRDLLRQAKSHGCNLVVFPELALTTFFPRWWMEDQTEIDSFFETAMPSNETAPLFEDAKQASMGFYLGFAEKIDAAGRTRRFNSSILVAPDGAVTGRYRKIHLPGHADNQPWFASSTWRSAISRWATSAGVCGAAWAACSAWRSATTAAGPRPTGSWGCKASRWS